MFLVAAYDFAVTIIIYIVRTENVFGIVRSEWIEFLQVAEEFRSDVSEINLGIDVDDGACPVSYTHLWYSHSRPMMGSDCILVRLMR